MRVVGAQIVCFGRDPVDGLEAEFADIGLRVLGPSHDQVLITADRMAQQRQHAATAIAAVAAQNVAMSAVDLFRRAVFAGGTDAVGANHWAGHLVNLQSVVTVFDHDDHRAPFADDMQFEGRCCVVG